MLRLFLPASKICQRLLVGRVKANRLAKLHDRLLPTAQSCQRHAEVVALVRGVGIDGDGFLEMLQRGLGPSLRDQQKADAAVCLGIFRLDAKRLVEMHARFPQPAEEQQRVRGVDVIDRVFGVLAERLPS